MWFEALAKRNTLLSSKVRSRFFAGAAGFEQRDFDHQFTPWLQWRRCSGPCYLVDCLLRHRSRPPGLSTELQRAGMDWRTAIRRALNDPVLAFQFGMSLLWGPVLQVEVQAARQAGDCRQVFPGVRPARHTRPGHRHFRRSLPGQFVTASPHDPYTHAPTAVIKFGNRVMLTGTRLGCLSRIEVEDDAGISDARITDGDFHSVAPTTDGPRYATEGVRSPSSSGAMPGSAPARWCSKA